MRTGWWGWAVISIAVYVPAFPTTARGQTDPTPLPPQRSGIELVPGDTVWATPDSRFDAGPIHRWVMGNGWRDLWGVPVPAQVLDLASFAGGLTPTRVGGGGQTRSLRFQGADGRGYGFRSIDKDASRTLDPVLRETLAASVVEDRIASLFPMSALVVDPLLDAAGVFHPNSILVVVPDDPRLGEFREEFAGLLGWLEERPDELEDDQPGFRGSSRVVGSDALFERLEEGPDDRVSAPGFLRARLMDFLVGDWDRHPDQWRWAGFEHDGVMVFEPVPRDRDWALSRLDGMASLLTTLPWPHYVGFDVEYPKVFRMSWSGRALDRRLLPELTWSDWEEVVDDLMARVDPAVIRAAVRRLPDSYYERVGAWLTDALLSRREELPRVARDFYELLAEAVDVRATDEAEVARVERIADGSVRLSIRRLGVDGGEPPHYERTFQPSETREIRVDLRGGGDRMEVVGETDGPIRIRLDGGGSDDTFVDETSGDGVYIYSDRGNDVLEVAPRTSVDRSEWEDPIDPDENTHRSGYRSWGSRWIPLPMAELSPDVGLLVGGGFRRTSYGFRHYPYETRVQGTVGIGTATGRVRADLVADLPLPFGSRGVVHLFVDDAEQDRFYGLGNGTASEADEAAYRAPRSHLSAGFSARNTGPAGLTTEVGAYIDAFRALDAVGTLVEALDPYGWGDFEQLRLRAALSWSGLSDDLSEGGLGLEVTGSYSPTRLDVTEPFGSLGGYVASRVRGGGYFRPVLALRAGGKKVWGDFPVHEAAYLGGTSTLRGFRNERFAGDASLFLGSELRVYLTDFVFLLPGQLGVLGLADVGRVFGDGTPAERWHTGWGGGVWVSALETYALSLAVARSDELAAVYFSLGFPF